MEYKDLPEAISSNKGSFNRIDRAIVHIRASAHKQAGKVHIKAGDEYLTLDADSFIELLEANQSCLKEELSVLEAHHDTLMKVAAGLLK